MGELATLALGIAVGIALAVAAMFAHRMLALKETRLLALEKRIGECEADCVDIEAAHTKATDTAEKHRKQLYALDRDCELMATRTNITRYTEK